MEKVDEERGFYQHSRAYEYIVRILNVTEIFADMIMRIYISSNEGSGWRFAKIIALLMYIHKYTPLRGSSYVKLSKHIEDHRYNVKNEDEQCF